MDPLPGPPTNLEPMIPHYTVRRCVLRTYTYWDDPNRGTPTPYGPYTLYYNEIPVSSSTGPPQGRVRSGLPSPWTHQSSKPWKQYAHGREAVTARARATCPWTQLPTSTPPTLPARRVPIHTCTYEYTHEPE
ncbi:hypothetical protein JMJ77_0014223 [Colletotrichum scovillei]|uniref:Uncharacterized protein n=1 Tax=Colletotrichum scovillei TaxID=1209932 RepID=A0A9P7R698_9PEZI|nr:hypothetical protein JMJ77_0014223 [Colletotrichum scovillei]KAG7065784.1 hypothetical protein JMJ78_0012531 [Colletotrichum scovillei]KAG7068354.1 hypothetical protein JMJ76_0008044 [Colletotrichum scovillei]